MPRTAETANRIRLIKDLQTGRNLPLATIKRLLRDPAGLAELRASLHNQPQVLQSPASPSMTRERLLTETNLAPSDLDEIEALALPPEAFVSVKNVRFGR